MKLLMLFFLLVSTLIVNGQRSSWNKTDRKYLCDKLNAYFEGFYKKIGNPQKVKLWHENDPRILSDTFSMAFEFIPEPCETTRAEWKQVGIHLAMDIYTTILKEFPQYKAIQLNTTCTGNKVIKLTLLVKDDDLLYDYHLNKDFAYNTSQRL